MKRLPFPKHPTAVFFILSALSIGGSTAMAQAPLDVRVMNERLDQIETQLRTLQSSGAPVGVQMPTAPENAGMPMESLPTDVASRLQVRILQLERLVETLTGQMEQTQFEMSQMRAQLQQLSNDVSYRLAVVEQAAGVSSAVALPAAPPPAMVNAQPQPQSVVGSSGPLTTPPTQTAPPPLPGQTSAFPGSVAQAPPSPVQTAPVQRAPSLNTPPAQVGRIEPDLNMPMSSPVQPQPQMATPVQPPTQMAVPGQEAAGTQLLAPGQIQTAPTNAGPVNQGNTFGVIRTDAEGNVLPPSPEAARQAAVAPPMQQPTTMAPPVIEAAPTPGPVASAQIGTAPDPVMAMTALPPGTPQEQYNYAFDILRQADYGRAETALRLFLQANAEDTLAGNAQYWLGETFYVRGDFEQAAVEFLSGYQTYPNSNKAPDNLLKLGLSMARLGQTDGACTALSRLSTEYPDANDTIQRRAQTERARLSCS